MLHKATNLCSIPFWYCLFDSGQEKMRNLSLSQFYVNPTKAQFGLIITFAVKHIFILYLPKNYFIFKSDN